MPDEMSLSMTSFLISRLRKGCVYNTVVLESNLVQFSGTRAEPASKFPLRTHLRIVLGVALAIGVLIRLVGLHSPPYDGHSFRQCQTLSTIEDFYRNGVDLLHPHTLYMGNPGVLVLEVPLFQAMGAGLYHIFGPHWELIRLMNIFFGIATAIILYRACLLLFEPSTAILAALIYWLAPLNILFQRSTLLEPMAVMWAMVSFYSLALLLNGPNKSEETVGNHFEVAPRNSWICFSVFAFATLLTALIKALYLWPAVLLFVQSALVRGCQLNRSLARLVVVFGIAGLCFVAWNKYSAQINAANPLTEGVKPTSLLGFSVLLKWDFYSVMVKTRPKEWLGLLGALFYLFGLWAWWLERRVAGWKSPWFLLMVVPPTYLVAFANINYPHDYYQLIITPFLAVVSARGVDWLFKRFERAPLNAACLRQHFVVLAVCVLTAAAVVNYLVWFKWPRIDNRLVKFEKLCAGQFEPWAATILFATPEATGLASGNYLPSYLYAGKLWGYSWTVPDAASAAGTFDTARQGFVRLDYLVFYGTEQPKWVPADKFSLKVRDEANHFFVFQARHLLGAGDFEAPHRSALYLATK